MVKALIIGSIVAFALVKLFGYVADQLQGIILLGG